MLSLPATLQQLYWKCKSKSQAITCVDKKTVLYEKELTEADQFCQLRMSKHALNLVKPEKVQKCSPLVLPALQWEQVQIIGKVFIVLQLEIHGILQCEITSCFYTLHPKYKHVQVSSSYKLQRVLHFWSHICHHPLYNSTLIHLELHLTDSALLFSSYEERGKKNRKMSLINQIGCECRISPPVPASRCPLSPDSLQATYPREITFSICTFLLVVSSFLL